MASQALPATRVARIADRRIRLLLALLLLFMVAVTARAAWLQVVRGDALGALAVRHQRFEVPLPLPRGTIFDRTGRALAASEQAVTVGASPRLVRDPVSLAAALAPLLGRDREALQTLLSRHDRAHVDLARQVDPDVAAKIQRRKLGAGALDFVPEERRVYPEGSVAAQVVGFAGLDRQGLGGVELWLDDELTAVPGMDTVVKDPAKRTIEVLEHKPGVPARNVTLTLDRDIQAHVEDVVAATRQLWQAKSATAVVLDPRTGGVLAMASAPGISAAGYGETPVPNRAIRAITDWYEPGSTFKAVTIGAALEEGRVTPATQFTVDYCVKRFDRTVCDAEKHERKVMTVSDILSHSSNVGTIAIAMESIGGRKLYRSIRRLGFGRPTGVDLPGEAAGSVLPYERWSGVSIVNIPIGEGVAVTPLQMAAFYAGIANGGTWQAPHVVQRIEGRPRRQVRTRQLFSPETNTALQQMLREVVDEGTGLKAQIPGYTVAGKTGTTQKFVPGKGYCGEPCGHYASFVGYVPAGHPRAVVLVVVDEPHGSYYGGEVAAPAFRSIGANVMQVLGVRPDQTVETVANP